MAIATRTYAKPDIHLNGIEVIRDGLTEELRSKRKVTNFRKSEEIYYQIMSDYYQKILDVKEEGKYLASHIFYCPTEILFAFDGIVPLSIEVSGDMSTAYAGLDVMEFRQMALAYGLPIEVCGAHAVPVGEVVAKVLPRPDVVIWSAQICDNTAKSGNDLARLFQCPGYFLDHPYNSSPEEVDYYVRDLQGLIKFLEEHTHQKLDYDRLCEAVRLSEEAIKLWKESNQLKKASPFPSRSIDAFLNMMTYSMLAGSPEAVAYFKQSRDEIKALVEARKGYLPQEERYRLMFLWLIPSYALDIFDWIEKEYGAVIVMDPFSSWAVEEEMDPSKTLESLVRKSFYIPGAHHQEGPMTAALRDAVKCAREYRIDGVINFAHLGCRQSCAIIRSLTDTLKEINIPTVTLDCDYYDPTSMTLEVMKDKLEGFFEVLEK